MDFKFARKGDFKMISRRDEYIKPEIMVIKFGTEDIVTSSADLDNNDPWGEDQDW